MTKSRRFWIDIFISFYHLLLLFSVKGVWRSCLKCLHVSCYKSHVDYKNILVLNEKKRVVQFIFVSLASPDNYGESHPKQGSFVVYSIVFPKTTISQSELSKHTCRDIVQKTGLRLQTSKTKACTGVW